MSFLIGLVVGAFFVGPLGVILGAYFFLRRAYYRHKDALESYYESFQEAAEHRDL